jgi:hypothetical protein
LSGLRNLSKKLDDLLFQYPATKISLCSNLNRVLVRSKMAVIDAVFPLNSSPTSEPLSLKLEPIILLASSWDNKHRLFAQDLKSARLWSTLLFVGAQFGVFKTSHNYEPQKTYGICLRVHWAVSVVADQNNFSFSSIFHSKSHSTKKTIKDRQTELKNFSSEPTILH